jgi:lysozyme
MRHINAAGLALIKSFEGLRLEAYRCAAGVLTIGWGSTGPHVKEGMTITLEEAETLLKTDLARFERGVEAMAPVATDNQFAAMVSLSFNIGLDAFRKSSVLKRHNRGDHKGAADAFLMWTKAAGRTLPGLVKRRSAERSLYMKADA